MSDTPDLDRLRRLLQNSPYDDATLLDYALGRLSAEMAAIIELHLEENAFDQGRLEQLHADLRTTARWLLHDDAEPHPSNLAEWLPWALQHWWETLASPPWTLAANDTASPLGTEHRFPLPMSMSARQFTVTVRNVAQGQELYMFTRDERIRDALRINDAPLDMAWSPHYQGWETIRLVAHGQPIDFSYDTSEGDGSSAAS